MTNFTILDIVIAVIIICTCASGLRRGTFIEIFKIAALVMSIFIGLHFYLPLSFFFDGLLNILHPVSKALAYGLLIGVGIGLFRILRDGVMVFLQQEDLKRLSKYLGAVLGTVRALLLGSMVLVGCLLIDGTVMKRMVRHSFSSQFLLIVAPAVYSGIFHGVVRPIFSKENENSEIMSLARQHRVRPD